MNNVKEYFRELYDFLPESIDPSIDDTQTLECEEDEIDAWADFYEDILGYDRVKQNNNICLMWNGVNHQIFWAPSFELNIVCKDEDDLQKEEVPDVLLSHSTKDIEMTYERCKEYDIKIVKDDRKGNKRILVAGPKGCDFEIYEE